MEMKKQPTSLLMIQHQDVHFAIVKHISSASFVSLGGVAKTLGTKLVNINEKMSIHFVQV